MKKISEAAEADEVIVTLTLQFKPGSAEKVLKRMVPSIRLTRAEPGNNEFQLFEAKNSKDKFVIFERWKNQAALEWHWEQTYTKEILALFEEHLAGPLAENEAVTYLTDVMKREE